MKRLSPLIAVLLLSAVLTVSGAGGNSLAANRLILQAGNADSDVGCLEALKQLSAMPDLTPELKSDLVVLLPVIDQWVNGECLNSYDRPFVASPLHDFYLSNDSPLYPLAAYFRGRMLLWAMLEYGDLSDYEEVRRPYLDEAVKSFRIAQAAFPENRIVRMYLGEPLPWGKKYPAVKGAPEWACLQREGLERVDAIITWWIDNRMRPDGQYGGTWGDDCEMWRWWAPVLLGFDDPKITRAQEKFSNALMDLPHMKGGYMSYMTDVEHSSEDSSDAVFPMMFLSPDDPKWNARARVPAELMETLWTGRNARGQLQFKSTYFTVDRVSGNPAQACDTVYHPRAVQPALLLWQRTGDDKLGKLFTDWMDAWVDVAARTDRGKPAGIIPSAMLWPDGIAGGLDDDEWWDPKNHSQTGLYAWPSAMSQMTETMLLTYYMTKNEKYLAPIRSMAAIRMNYLAKPEKPSDPAPGSVDWCAQSLGLLSETLAKYRRLTGDTSFDALLTHDYPSALGDDPARENLTAGLRANAEALRVNFEGYTSEVRYTDRVLEFPGLFTYYRMIPRPDPRIKNPDVMLLYRSATGDPGSPSYFPMNAVRWLTPPRDIAALVTESGADGFSAELFHFGPATRKMSAELYLLAPGEYRMELFSEGKSVTKQKSVMVSGSRTRINIDLPARKLCVLKLTPVEK